MRKLLVMQTYFFVFKNTYVLTNQSQVSFNQNASCVDVAFSLSKPVILTDDVKFKFYTSNVST